MAMMLNMIHGIVMIIACIIFTQAYRKRKDLRFWYISCLVSAVGYVANAIPSDSAVNPIAMIFFTMGTFLLMYAVIREYRETFHRNKKLKTTVKKILPAVVTMGLGEMSFYLIL